MPRNLDSVCETQALNSPFPCRIKSKHSKEFVALSFLSCKKVLSLVDNLNDDGSSFSTLNGNTEAATQRSS